MRDDIGWDFYVPVVNKVKQPRKHTSGVHSWSYAAETIIGFSKPLISLDSHHCNAKVKEIFGSDLNTLYIITYIDAPPCENLGVDHVI